MNLHFFFWIIGRKFNTQYYIQRICIGGFLYKGETQRRKLWVVSRCGQTWTGSKDIQQLCEDIDLNDTSLFQPVITRENVVYRNRHCAICNIVSVSKELTILINVKAICQDTDRMQEIIKHGITYNHARKHCQFEFDIDRPIGYFVNTASYCIKDLVMDQCPYEPAPSTDLDSDICKLYSAPQNPNPDDQELTVYKNPHCVKCQDYSPLNCKQAIIRRPPPSLSLLLDFSPQKETETDIEKFTCPPGKIWDSLSSVCRDIVCSKGVPQNGCLANENGTVENLGNKTSMTLIVSLTNSSRNVSSVYHTVLALLIDNEFNVSIEHSPLLRDCKRKYEAYSDDEDNCTTLKNGMHSCMTFAVGITKSRLNLNVLSNMFYDIYKVLNYNMYNSEMTFQMYKSNSANTCPSSEKRLYGGDQVSIVGDTVMINNQSFNMNEFSLSFYFGTCSRKKNRLISLALCNSSKSLGCKMVSFAKDEYDITNYIVTLKASGLVLNPEEYKQDKGNILVCTDRLDFLKSNDFSIFFTSGPQPILTLVGLCLSITCLALTLFTYCLFSVLRTLPGKCIIGLCITLLIAQLLFLLNRHFTDNLHMCIVIAIILHYVWLSTFIWMAVLSYDISTTTSIKSGLRGNEQKNKTFKLYTLCACCCPAVVVGICVCIDNLTSGQFQYGGPANCWISGREALMYSFALPIAAILLFNVCFFIKTVIELKAAKKAAKNIAKNQRNTSNLLVYVKISSLMGFTWVFGFAAAFTGISEIWYLFIVFNTLQGVFICISFTFTKRVWHMYKKKFNGDSEMSQASQGTSSGRVNSSSTAISSSF